jgi:hypothetical protein
MKTCISRQDTSHHAGGTHAAAPRSEAMSSSPPASMPASPTYVLSDETRYEAG